MYNRFVAFALGCVAMVACAAPMDEAQSEATGEVSQPWVTSDPSNTSQRTDIGTVTIGSCSYTAYTLYQAPPYPPHYLTMLSTSGSGCANGTTQLGSSYASTSVSLARHPVLPLLAVSFSIKSSPSGSSPKHLEIRSLSVADGSVIGRCGIYASTTPGGTNPTSVESGALSINAAGDLTVTGTTSGYIAGSTTAGSHYRAVYNGFMYTAGTCGAPSSVVQY